MCLDRTQRSGRASVWALPETDQLWVRRMESWERPPHRFLSCSFLSCFSFSSLTRVFRKPVRVGKAASYLPPREKQTFALTRSPWSSPAHHFCHSLAHSQCSCPELTEPSRASSFQNWVRCFGPLVVDGLGFSILLDPRVLDTEEAFWLFNRLTQEMRGGEIFMPQDTD